MDKEEIINYSQMKYILNLGLLLEAYLSLVCYTILSLIKKEERQVPHSLSCTHILVVMYRENAPKLTSVNLSW